MLKDLKNKVVERGCWVMPEIDSRVAYFKSTIRDFIDLVERRAKREKVLTTDIGCRREMENLEKEAVYQKKLFGIL